MRQDERPTTSNCRKRKLDDSMTDVFSSGSWVEEFNALEQREGSNEVRYMLGKALQECQSRKTQTPLTSCSSSLYKSYSKKSITSLRLQRLLRQLDSVTLLVAIHVLESVNNGDLFERYRTEFVQWGVLSVAEQLRDLFSVSEERGCSPIVKRRRLSKSVDEDKRLAYEAIEDKLEYFYSISSTAYDDLVLGIVESFRFHPLRSSKLFQSAIAKNMHCYPAYLHSMEVYRQLGSKLDCVKVLKCGQYICQSEILDVELELQLERDSYVRKFGFSWGSNGNETPLLRSLSSTLAELKSMEKVFEGVVRFFSDGSAEEMLKAFHDSVQIDPNSVYGYCNLGILNGFNLNADEETLALGVQLLNKAIELCKEKENGVIASFLYHTLAQTYMRMNDSDTAMLYLERALSINPTMILALFDKSAILKERKDYETALAENDKLIALCPESTFELSNILCSRVILEYKLGRNKESLASLEAAASVDPRNSFANIMMAKRAIITNDMQLFDQVKETLPLYKDYLHITNFLHYLVDAMNHVDRSEEAKGYKAQLEYYSNIHNRIE